MDKSSFCPVRSGLSAVKLSPELLKSMVRPDPVCAGAKRSKTA